MKKILVTGGAGYLGHILVPALIERGHSVTVIDLCWFGDHLSERFADNPRFKMFKADIRDIDVVKKALRGCDTVIHLACISNDPCSELDEGLTSSINYDAYEPLLKAAKKAGVRRFINASSSSVYGVKQEQRITEDLSLEPLTLYARCKAESERVVQSFESPDFKTISVRSATLCGYSPRQRLDLTVNILTNFALNKGKIIVHGGSQQRPNIHIQDIADFYTMLVEMDTSNWEGLAYNVGYQNHSVMEIAKIVRKVVGRENVDIEVADTQDLRSYRIDSSLVKERLGFEPRYTLEDAVGGLKKAFDSGLLPNSFEDPRYFNIKAMQEMGIGSKKS